MSVLGKVRRRVRGLPRSFRELDRSLALLELHREFGWQRAVNAGLPISQMGAALPWYSYPAIAWLSQQLRSTDHVFEFGAGNSTYWYAARVASVVTVEHNAAWVERLRNQSIPANVTLLHREPPEHGRLAASGPYVEALTGQGRAFDLIAIDGVARNECMRVATEHLTPDGLIVVDNSDRSAYGAGLDLLTAAGLGRVDFFGVPPGTAVWTCTSIFSPNISDRQRPSLPVALREY